MRAKRKGGVPLGLANGNLEHSAQQQRNSNGFSQTLQSNLLPVSGETSKK